MADTGGIVVGLLAAHDDRDLAEALAEDLPETLRERVDDGTDWQARSGRPIPRTPPPARRSWWSRSGAACWTAAGSWASA
jgi:hypothetical protein